jgi:hypothetical protein
MDCWIAGLLDRWGISEGRGSAFNRGFSDQSTVCRDDRQLGRSQLRRMHCDAFDQLPSGKCEGYCDPEAIFLAYLE